ncbi:NAD(P)-binding protein [Annulohypoxylon truncatum]|uniref:NAD(P)-binding protein n=1 Tax=Annulohypoxylon truncatum TaxID=327061 RepID=UPI0020079175|nr:NAD(P)-binding protein [Annulohypoxylon truncatum]KAI1211979.1 NAD(P)-binding protein [Annulohypoxylon truncatum]
MRFEIYLETKIIDYSSGLPNRILVNMSYQRTIIVTGGTVGLGYYTALEIAKAHPEYLVVVSSRTDREHAADAINKTLGQRNTVYIPLDLSNLQKVRAYAEDWAAKSYPPIQALVFNAGLQFPGGLTKTVDGLESTFAINHVGHALLFHLLCLYLAPKARVVITSSGTHDPDQISGGMPKPKYISAEVLAHPTAATATDPGRKRYVESKLANVLWGYALGRRLQERVPERGITVTSFDPGLMPGTGLAREANAFEKFLWMRVLPKLIPLIRALIFSNVHRPQESAVALARLVIGADVEGESGKYFEGMKVIKSSKDSYDVAKQDDLWMWTVGYLAKGDGERERFEQFK